MQFAWPALPTREITVEVGDRRATSEVGPPAWLHHLRSGRSRRLDKRCGGPGSIVVDGLESATTYPVWVHGPGQDRTLLGHVTTLSPPPGRLLSRFTTMSDTHFGETDFGFTKNIVEVHPPDADIAPFPERCALAALREAEAWGTTLMVVKGDLTGRSRPGEFADAHRVLVGSGLDCVAQLGNHDVRESIDPLAFLSGIETAGPDGIVIRDLPGVRLVLGHSPLAGASHGDLDHEAVEELADAVGDASGAAVVCLHHAPQRFPVPTFYPPGIRRDASRRLTTALRTANPATLVLAGHSHRNRRYTVDGIDVAEVSSTKDYPGVWAGYAVHERGIRQVVRRISSSDVVGWIESTAAALAGQWGRWSPGALDDRCWSHPWPSR